MRIKPFALASACLFAITNPAVASVDPVLSPAPSKAVELLDQAPRSNAVVVPSTLLGLPALDRLKTDADRDGLSYVAQAETELEIKTDIASVQATAAVAQVQSAQSLNYRFFATLMIVLAGLFMWLTLAPRRKSS